MKRPLLLLGMLLAPGGALAAPSMEQAKADSGLRFNEGSECSLEGRRRTGLESLGTWSDTVLTYSPNAGILTP